MNAEIGATLGDAVFITAFCVPAAIVGFLVWRYDRRPRWLPFTRQLAGLWAIAMLLMCLFGWALYFFGRNSAS